MVTGHRTLLPEFVPQALCAKVSVSFGSLSEEQAAPNVAEEQSRSLHELKHEIQVHIASVKSSQVSQVQFWHFLFVEYPSIPQVQANMKLFQSETVKGAMDDADSVPINLASLHTLAVHSHAKHQNLDMIAPPIRSFNIQYGMSFMGACTVYPSVSILLL